MDKDMLREIVYRVCPAAMKYSGHQFVSEGIFDSVEIMEIVTEIEDIFGIDIGAQYIVPEYFESIDTLEKLVQDVRKG